MLIFLQQLKKQTKGAKAMTDSLEQYNEREKPIPTNLGFLEELLRDAGLLRGSGLDQLFTTVGARGVPLVPEVTTTEQSPAMPSGADKLSNLGDAELAAADRTSATMPDGSIHK